MFDSQECPWQTSVITSVSLNPAQLIRPQADLGQLRPGREANNAVLQVEELGLPGLPAVGCAGQQRNITKVFRPKYVIRQGDNKNFMATFSFSISISNVES